MAYDWWLEDGAKQWLSSLLALAEYYYKTSGFKTEDSSFASLIYEKIIIEVPYLLKLILFFSCFIFQLPLI
jgi:hypothetical protein